MGHDMTPDKTDGQEAGRIACFNGRCLGPMRAEYLETLKEWRNAQMDVLRQWKPLTDHNQARWFQRISEDDTQVIFAILEDGKFIGYCGIVNINFLQRRGEISFLVDPARANDKKLYRIDFLSTLYLLYSHGFGELNLHKLFTETFEKRKDHIKVLEESGMARDGRLRDHQFINGTYYDSIMHSMLSAEWAASEERIRHALGQ